MSPPDLAFVAGSLILAACQLAPAQPSFTPLGHLPAPTPWSHAYAVSPDTATIVGQSVTGPATSQAVRRSGASGLAGLGELPGGSPISLARGVSTGGAVIVGSASPAGSAPVPFRWTPQSQMQLLPVAEGDAVGSAAAVSADGAVIVGSIGPTESALRAVSWTGGGPPVVLGFFPGGAFSRATAVSSNGSVVVGSARRSSGLEEAFRWTQSGGMVGLGSLQGGTGFWRSTAEAVSADGSVVVGSSMSSNGTQAFRWTAAEGIAPLSAGFRESMAYGISADGSVIVGSAASPGISSPFRAVIWTAADGPRDLKTLLEGKLGLELPGWHLTAATAVSTDGLTIVGYGTNPAGDTEGWIAVLAGENPCPADFDGNGQVNSGDITAFLSAWLGDLSAGTTHADFDNSGATNSGDITAFLSAWLAAIAQGC